MDNREKGIASLILGINAYHGDASACLVRDGVLVAAAEEERFRRIKHWAGFPAESVRWCLREAGVALSDVAHVAVNQDAGANLWKKVAFLVTRRPDLSLVFDRIRNKRERAGIGETLACELGASFGGEVHFVEHHLAHLGSAYLVSPFAEAAAVSVDGFGDFASAAWGVGRNGAIEVEDKVYFPHSLGIFYQALTQYLGFPHYGDEYKVMGLAPYGEPAYLDRMRRIVRLRDDGGFRLDLSFFRHATEKVDYEWESGEPVVGRLYTPALEALLGPARGKDEAMTPRHKDIARSVQAMYEEAFFRLLNAVHRKYRVDALALAGGCAMNSVANGKVYRHTPFKRLYVQSAAGDAGGAIGAAFVAWHRMHKGHAGGDSSPTKVANEFAPTAGGRDGNEFVSTSMGFVGGDLSPTSPTPRTKVANEFAPTGNGVGRFVMDHAYWGPEYSNAEIGALLDLKDSEIRVQGCAVERIGEENELCRRTAQAIAAGLVVGWFQGRMEWGPRALGNRSIVCDPRRADMKDVLNLKIKRRESFRPFAPSILREAVPEWFETDDDVPFMMQVYPIRPEKRALIPAVTHVDGSGRLQTVSRDANPRYYRLIQAFAGISGIPVVLNTSFNENEPVVCRPEEALDCFLRTRMDVLVLGDWYIARSEDDAGL